MPATSLSLRVTEEYRAKLTALPRAVQREARILWKDLDWDDLRGSYAPIRERLATSIEYAQREAVHLTAGYMGAFLTSELGKPTDPPILAADPYIGRSFNDTPLRDALDTPLITVLVGIRDGMDDPLGLGLRTLLANVDLHVMRAGRQSLIDAIAADEHCDGFQRAVKGTCPACAAKAGADGKVQFPVHPGCQCVGEPNVRTRFRDRFRRRNAEERFDDLSFDAQNDLYGFEVAQLIRDARVTADDLARVDGSFMSTKPLKDLRPKPSSPLDFGERMRRVSRGVSEDKPKQLSKDFNEVFDEAERVKQEYRELLDLGNELQTRLHAKAFIEDDLAKFEEGAARLSAADDIQVIIAPLKRRATAEGKLARKPYGPEGLTDLNRGSILVRNIDDIPGVLAQVRRAAKERGWTVHEVDDAFTGQAKLGYRDVSLALRSPSGHVTELQFHANNMWAAKFRGGGHKLYEEMRKFDEIESERALTGLEKAKLRRLREQSVNLYNKALEAPPKQVIKVTERPSGAAVSARLDEMSVGEAETYVLGPTNRAAREVLKGNTETRFMHAVREGRDARIIWQRNRYLFDQRWDVPMWTRERKKLHEKIIKKFLNGEIREEGIGVPKRVENPRLVSTAGGGASGKSSMIRAGQVDFGSDGAVTVANDLIKEQLPEYVKMVAMKDPWAANAVNEESAYIAKQIAEAAVKNHYNVLLDIVGDGPAGVFAQSIRGFEGAGYTIEVDYASCPLALALRRALVREAKTGRRADPEAVAQAHLSVAERFNEINAIDKAAVRVYDTTTDGPIPLLVYEKLPRQHGKVIDKAGWQRWLDKRTEQIDPAPAAELRAAQIRPSNAIRAQKVPLGPHRVAVNKAIRAVDKTHHYPNGTPETVVKQAKLKLQEGNFSKREIQIADDAQDVTETMLHELGHKADMALARDVDKAFASGGKTGRGAFVAADVKKVIEALQNSDAVKRLERGWTAKQYDYYTQPHELFARAYSQWITQREGLGGMVRGEVDAGVQWEDNDFKAIAEALEELFRGRGLLV